MSHLVKAYAASLSHTPAKRRAVTTQGLATLMPTIPDSKLGYAEKERQHVDQRILDWKGMRE